MSSTKPVFDLTAFGKPVVDFIGVGAIGSTVAKALSLKGISPIRISDFDKVSSGNVKNQQFKLSQVGMPKVEALKANIAEVSDSEIITRNCRIKGTEELGEIIFLFPDKMAARREIWDKAIRFNEKVRVMFDARMGPTAGRVYVVNPNLERDVEGYEEVCKPENHAWRAQQPRTACGGSEPIGETVGLLSSLVVWQFNNWFAKEMGASIELYNEIIEYPESMERFRRKFGQDSKDF